MQITIISIGIAAVQKGWMYDYSYILLSVWPLISYKLSNFQANA